MGSRGAAALLGDHELAKVVAADVKAMLKADGTWQRMSITEREKITKVYQTTRTRHLSNTFLDGGAKAEQKWLAGKLEVSLSSAEVQALRGSPDVTALVRAVSKDVGEGIKVYAKGSATKFRAWLKKHHAGALYYLKVERVDLGVRQDSKTEAAFAMYHNRRSSSRSLGLSFCSAARLVAAE